MKAFLAVCRVVVGTLFIISGLIKANDPYGFTYKLEEYFEVFVHDLSYKKVPAPVDSAAIAAQPTVCPDKFKPKQEMVDEEIPAENRNFVSNTLIGIFKFFKKEQNALFLAVFICILEIVLGLCTITGYAMRISAWLLFLMIIFFTFLTFYSAYFNKVTDCGCFGDALKLSPWQSFMKDIGLLVFILPLFIFQKRIKGYALDRYEIGISIASIVLMTLLCILQFKWLFPIWFLLGLLAARYLLAKVSRPVVTQLLVLVLVTFGSTAFAVNCINHLAMRDYRPWRIGSNVRELAKSAPEQAEVLLVYVNNSTCEEDLISINPEDPTYKKLSDSTWRANHTFLKQDKKIKKAAVDAKVKDFTLENREEGTNMGDSLLNHPGYAFLFVARDLDAVTISSKAMERVNEIAAYAENNGLMFIAATSSYGETVEKFRLKYQTPFMFHINDGTSLKTILRPGPGLVLLKDGVVMGKWQWNDIPSLEKLQKKYLD